MNETDLDYLLLADGSEGEVSTLLIKIGEVAIMIMGETESVGEGLQQAHIQVDPPSARILTRRTMSVIVDRILEDTGYAEIIIRGAARTTGARQGHTPRELRFARGIDSDA